MQGKMLCPHSNFNEKLSLQRFRDCKIDDLNITYTIQQMQYHMFFSSMEYTEPDVLVIYSTTLEIFEFIETAIHKELLYRSMRYSTDTALVLMDQTKELMAQEVNDVNPVTSVDQIVYTKLKITLENLSNNNTLNDNYHFTWPRISNPY